MKGLPALPDPVLRALYLLAFGCWFASLWLPALSARGAPTFTGLDVLLQGWSAWRDGVLSWFANPCLMAAIAAGLCRKRRQAAAFGVLAALLGLSSLWAGSMAEIAGRSVPELFFLPGFYVWMAALLAALTGGIVGLNANRHA